MARVNVFLNDELPDQINKEAKNERANRSALIQAAIEEYLQLKRKRREEHERRKTMKEACETMGRLARQLGRWVAQGIIRRLCDTHLKGDG